jgi:hypothetical protein
MRLMLSSSRLKPHVNDSCLTRVTPWRKTQSTTWRGGCGLAGRNNPMRMTRWDLKATLDELLGKRFLTICLPF